MTAVNVLGDAMGTGIVQHLSRDDLEQQSGENDVIVLDELCKQDNSGANV